MATLKIEAHCVDEQFEKEIKVDYGVAIIDRSDEPWCVVFEGDRSKLVAMVAEHWGEDRAKCIGQAIQNGD
jgi:hypothetical protein